MDGPDDGILLRGKDALPSSFLIDDKEDENGKLARGEVVNDVMDYNRSVNDIPIGKLRRSSSNNNRKYREHK